MKKSIKNLNSTVPTCNHNEHYKFEWNALLQMFNQKPKAIKTSRKIKSKRFNLVNVWIVWMQFAFYMYFSHM